MRFQQSLFGFNLKEENTPGIFNFCNEIDYKRFLCFLFFFAFFFSWLEGVKQDKHMSAMRKIFTHRQQLWANSKRNRVDLFFKK